MRRNVYLLTSQGAQNYEAQKALLNLLLGARTFMYQKKFFSPAERNFYVLLSADFF